MFVRLYKQFSSPPLLPLNTLTHSDTNTETHTHRLAKDSSASLLTIFYNYTDFGVKNAKGNLVDIIYGKEFDAR